MKKSSELKVSREDKVKELDSLLKSCGENEMTDEQAAQFDTLTEEIETLGKDIDRAVKAEAIFAQRAAAHVATAEQDSEEKELDKLATEFSMIKFMKGVSGKLEGVELEMHQKGLQEAANLSGHINPKSRIIPLEMLKRMKVQRRDLTAGTTTEGGHTVATATMGYLEALQATSICTRLGADYVTGLTGNFGMPAENAVFTPAWEGENDANAESSPTFTKVSFSPKRLGGYIDVSNQLLLQSGVGIDNRMKSQMVLGNALALDRAGINGAGASDEPTGILNASGTSTVAIGTNGGAITRDHILQLIQASEIANAHIGSLAMLTTPQVKKVLKELALDSGSGRFVWADDNTIEGYTAFISNQVPSDLSKGTGTDLDALIFGNFADLMFAQWGGLEVMEDPYTQSLSGITRYVINTYCDVNVLRGASFSLVKDIDPTA